MRDDGPAGWMIGVLLELDDEPNPLRHFYAVAQPDQARAEWAAADRALLAGVIASSPYGGMEPVEALGALSGHALRHLALQPGQTKELGRKWPRRFLTGSSG
jgi:hypothetical protein